VAGDILADLAEKFGGNAQIGSNLRTGDSQRKFRVLIEKCQISFFRGVADVLERMMLQFNKLVFDYHPKVAIEFRTVDVKKKEVGFVDL